MLERSLSLIPAALLGVVLFAQDPAGTELVPNGGFEELKKEPSTYDQLSLARGWSNATNGLSEVFTKAGSARTIGIPDNDYGHADPVEGDHYAGFFAWKNDVQRNTDPNGADLYVPAWSAYTEYLTAELNEPLKEGHTYHVTFKVMLSANSDRAVSGIGAYFSPEAVHRQHRKFLEENPPVAEEPILDKKGEWVEVSGDFEADGGERYVVIGAFKAAGFDSKKLTEGNDNQYAYYYIDSISLKEVH